MPHSQHNRTNPECNRRTITLFPLQRALRRREKQLLFRFSVVTDLVTVNGNSQAANGENTERRHGSTQGLGWKLHHVTRKQNHQHTTTTREGPRNNNRILRTHHLDPRPPRILAQTIRKSRRSSGRTFAGVFRRSFDLKLFGSTAAFVHAANLGNLSHKVCCFSNYKVRIVRTFEYPPFRSTSNPTLSD